MFNSCCCNTLCLLTGGIAGYYFGKHEVEKEGIDSDYRIVNTGVEMNSLLFKNSTNSYSFRPPSPSPVSFTPPPNASFMEPDSPPLSFLFEKRGKEMQERESEKRERGNEKQEEDDEDEIYRWR